MLHLRVNSPQPACRSAVRAQAAAASTPCPAVSHGRWSPSRKYPSGAHGYHSHSRSQNCLRRDSPSPVRGSRHGSAVCAATSSQTPVQLSDEELGARQRFIDQAGTGSGEGGKGAALALLEEAASTRQVDQELVLGALAYLEDVSTRGSAQPADALEELEGKWRLVYSSGTVSFLRYIPVKEYFSIAIALRSAALSSDIGPLHTRFSGNFSWRGPTDMDFAFTNTLVNFAGRELVNKPREASPKTWTFFHAGPRIAAARSSAGGLNLMLRESAFAADS